VYLKRLEIHGFKTFATPTVFEYRPGITAVVGPNGSGKSNVADAVRWALGEQSYAALRCKRTEDLIFSGGGRRAPSGFAEVSLTIDNSDRLLPLPYGEVTLTRRATRAGENEYLINRSRVRLRDIHEAIGPLGGSYTIINQGLVDAALTLRPEERRRLFEDAAEIGTFVSRKSEAESRLRETNANMERCADVLAELEPRLRSLKRQASLARTYREMADELRTLLVQYYTQSWRAARQVLAQAEAAEQTQAGELASHRAAQAAATAELRESREALRTLRERLGALHNDSSALHTRAEEVQRDLAVQTERLAALSRREEEAERSRRDVALRREELERERAAIVERLAAAEERLKVAREAIAAHAAEVTVHEADSRAARQRLDAAQREEIAAAAALNENARRAEQLTAQRERLAQEHATQADALTLADSELARKRAELAEAEAHLAAASQARAAAAAAEERVRTELDALRQERAHADEALSATRRALADVEARHETLNRLQRSYAGTFAGVKAAMQWAESQGRDGFALVSSLIGAPARLETAIEVALGSRLQNIVVERWEDAEETIAALKKSGAGRATFLPLDTIRGQGSGARGQGPGKSSDPRSPTPDPRILGVAAELVDYDERYRDVAWYLLGRTLVVEDLPTARQALRGLSGGWTIVTLAGEQVNSGGAVTGGAQIKESGTLRRERELRELPEQIAQRQRDVAEQTQSRADLDARLSAAEQALREAEATRRRANQELDALREGENRARREAERAETALDGQRRRHAQLVADIAALDEQMGALQTEQEAIQQRRQAAQEHLATLRADEQSRAEAERDAQTRRTELQSVAAAAEGELKAERALLQSHDQQITRLDEQAAAAARRMQEAAQERATTDTQLQTLQTAHTALLAQIDELRALIDPAEAEMDLLERTRADLEQREAELTAALLESETAHSRALVEAQRAKDRLDSIWERAAADDVDVEALVSDPLSVVDDEGRRMKDEGRTTNDETDDRPPTTDHRPPTNNGEDGDMETGDAPRTTHHAPHTTHDERLETESDHGQPTTDDLHSKIQHLKSRITRLGAVNPLALEEYEEESKRHSFMTEQLADLRQAAQSLRELIAELDIAMQQRFAATFHAIAEEFEKRFVQLFGGGEAKLSLIGPQTNGAANGNGHAHESIDDVGVEIMVRPPGKRQQNISLLSGGERALTAAALLFAILTVNPSPFCILDEVDAALDEANVGRFRAMLAEMSQQTQFMLVTHNRGTIESADTIYGVTMGDDGSSKVLSLRLEEVAVE
jgi:chromosome segregation protein